MGRSTHCGYQYMFTASGHPCATGFALCSASRLKQLWLRHAGNSVRTAAMAPLLVVQAHGGTALIKCTRDCHARSECFTRNKPLRAACCVPADLHARTGWGARLRLQHDAGVLRVAHAALAGQAAVQRVAGIQAQPRRGGEHLQRAPARRRPQPRRALRPALQGTELRVFRLRGGARER